MALVERLDRPEWASAYVHWELGLLGELGFGLDLEACAATGAREGLVYVSPRTGRAVSSDAGAPWRDRLLPLPAFLAKPGKSAAIVDTDQVLDGLRLTGHFLERHVFAAREGGTPAARERLIDRVRRLAASKAG